MSSPNISLRNMVCGFFFSVEHEVTGSIFWSIMLHLPYAPTSVDFQGQSFNEKFKLQKNLPSVISPEEKSHANSSVCWHPLWV